jgi:hypothetical protein
MQHNKKKRNTRERKGECAGKKNGECDYVRVDD